jgi:phosphatidylserine/phosphatidylglycerophosphate/cardiolipin synthase-like enzyme
VDNTVPRIGGAWLSGREVQSLADEFAQMWIGAGDRAEARRSARVAGREHAINPQDQLRLPDWQRIPDVETHAVQRVARQSGQQHGQAEGRRPRAVRPTDAPEPDASTA